MQVEPAAFFKLHPICYTCLLLELAWESGQEEVAFVFVSQDYPREFTLLKFSGVRLRNPEVVVAVGCAHLRERLRRALEVAGAVAGNALPHRVAKMLRSRCILAALVKPAALLVRREPEVGEGEARRAQRP